MQIANLLNPSRTRTNQAFDFSRQARSSSLDPANFSWFKFGYFFFIKIFRDASHLLKDNSIWKNLIILLYLVGRYAINISRRMGYSRLYGTLVDSIVGSGFTGALSEAEWYENCKFCRYYEMNEKDGNGLLGNRVLGLIVIAGG